MENPIKSNKIQQPSIKQKKALELLLEGKTDAEVALAVGVGRDTINRWRNHHPHFLEVLDEQREHLEPIPMRVHNLYARAVDVLEKALDRSDPKVAIAILRSFTLNGKSVSPRRRTEPELSLLEQGEEQAGASDGYSENLPC